MNRLRLRWADHVPSTWRNDFPVNKRHLASVVFIAIPKACLSSFSLERRNSRFLQSLQILPNSSISPPIQSPMGSANKEPRIPDDARKILVRLAAEWRHEIVDPEALQVVPLKGAMTNQVYQIRWIRNSKTDDPLPRSKKVLVRIYGAGVDVFFDRENEIRTFEFLSKQGQGPRLLGRFANGRVEEFIRARTLTAADLRDPEISSLIASKVKEFHGLDMPGSKNIVLWDRIRKWLNEARRISSPQEAKEFQLDVLEAEISTLEKNLSTNGRRLGFCHNDLQYGNIMMDEETRSITIIDYEYACYNQIAYDIANHFCEMAADYHTETPHVLDYRKYPDLQERERFVRIYLTASGNQPSDSEVKQLLQEVEKYTLASHILWCLWGLISDHVNEIDFDYIEYARQRFQTYWAKKEKQFGNIIDALIGTGDFGGWANLLSSANPSFLPLTATLFIPCNDAISQLLSAATAGAQFDPLLIPYHTVPQRLTFSDLRKLAAHTRLPTLLPAKFIVITNSSTSNFTVDASQITQPDIFLNPAFALHGVTKILDYSVFNGGGSPVLPPSMSETAGLSQWRKKLSPPGERSDARCSCIRIPVILWTFFAVLFISRFFEF
ncbi:Protein kinase superfamily protein [Perilla frutescens var. frutescens]|nr:Protein kinase superfamily protein [Perilla frutescens var. frutescens]